MTAAAQETPPLAHLAAEWGVRLDHAADITAGARRVRLVSNDPVVTAYAAAVLRAAGARPPGPGDPPPDAVCLAVLAGRPVLDRLALPASPATGPVSLHRGRTGHGALLSAADGFRLFRVPGTEDRFVTDIGSRTVLYAGHRDDPRALREPAWLAEALLTAVTAQDGPVLAGTALATAAGAVLLLDGGSGTAAAALPLLHGHAMDLAAWSAVRLSADQGEPGEPGRLTVHGMPGPCEVPELLVRHSPALIRRTCLADHPALALAGTEARDGTVTLTADELVHALGRTRAERAPLALLAAEGGTPREAAVRRATTVAAARYPAWHGIGRTPAPADGVLSGTALAARPWAEVDTYDRSAADGLAAELLRRRLTEPVPDLPDARNWTRAPMTGRWVAVMEHRRLTRGMRLERWQTRAVCAGAVHELMTTPAPPPPGGDRVDEIAYLGFAEFGAGLLAVGDAVREADGTLLGHVLGFDDTHLPNHMNVILLSADRRTGRQRGLTAGGGVHVVSPADVRPRQEGGSA